MNLQMCSDFELLSKLIGIETVAQKYDGSLRSLFSKTDSSFHMLHVAREFMVRVSLEELMHVPSLSSPEAVKKYLRYLYFEKTYEVFVCLFLDVNNRLIASEEMFRGTLTHTSVYPREVIRRTLELNAAAVIFSHNHPSGVSEPSASDIQLTENLRTTLALIDVRVLDHLIIAGHYVTSFAEKGLL